MADENISGGLRKGAATARAKTLARTQADQINVMQWLEDSGLEK